MVARESELVKRTKAYIKEHGGYVVKTAPPIEAGTPDLLVCWHGRFVGIELKAKGKKPRLLQHARMQSIRQAGGVAFWADNMESVISELGMLEGAEPC